MAVTGSGPIGLIADVNNEINGNTTDYNVSLTTLSTGAGKSAPHGLTEFYGYSSATAPTLGGTSASSVSTSGMTLNGSVSSDGNATVTERGFYFGTSTNRASNTKYTVGSGTGSFSSARSGLSAASTYYFWSYATNSVGTTYSGMVTQATSTPSVSGTFSSGATWGTWNPASGSAPGNCATAALTASASMTAGGYTRGGSPTVTCTYWITNQSANTCNTPSYGFMSNTVVGIYGSWTFGPSGNGGCGAKYEMWTASGYSTWYIHRGTICC